MQISSPILPLSKAAFARALRTGHGRAIQHINEYGSSGLASTIIKACVTSISYDPQLEADRAPWLFSIVDRVKLSANVVQAIQALENKPPLEDFWGSVQRSAILKELAAAGSVDAKSLLYSSFARSPNTANVIGAQQIIELDGLDGLVYVSRQIGQWMQADPDFWDDDTLITEFDASTQGNAGLAALEREAAADPNIATYLSGIRKKHDSLSRPSKRVDAMFSEGEDVVTYIQKSPREQCYWLRGWGNRATSDQLEVVFFALVASRESEQVKRLFRCFAKISIPRFDSRLLRWIDHPDASVQRAAVAALAHITHGEIRKVAHRLIAGGSIAHGVALLVNNFQRGDFLWCAMHLSPLADADETHHLVEHLLDLCEAHPGQEALDCLLYVYEFSPCSTCRKRAVKALIDTNTAPGWVLTESAFDADPETQKLSPATARQ